MKMVISVITPSYNQGLFIERTIRSVLDQSGDFSIEYFIADGGSTDDTVKIIRDYEFRVREGVYPIRCQGVKLSWVSETDRGQADAVNKGILNTSGEIIAWINSDDIYYPGAFAAVTDFFSRNTAVHAVYGRSNHIDEHDRIIKPYPTEPWSYKRLFDICFLCQPAVFFLRSLVDKCGSLDPDLQFCMDYELWLRYGCETEFHFLERLVAGSRLYQTNKTMAQTVAVHHEINDMFRKKFGQVPRRWIYGFARTVEQERQKSVYSGQVDLDRVREVAQDAFLKWWGYIPPEELEYMDLFVSVPRSNRWPVRRQLEGLNCLRIGIDTNQTFPQIAGSEQIADMLVRDLAKTNSDEQFIIYNCPSAFFYGTDSEEETLKIELENVHYADATLNSGQSRDFRVRSPNNLMANLGYPDVIHVSSCDFPDINDAKIVFSVFDLSFVDHPELYTQTTLESLRQGLKFAAESADMIIAVTNYLKSKFLEIYPEFPSYRIKTINLASRFDCEQTSTAEQGLEKDGFWLYSGPVEPIANLHNILAGYQLHLMSCPEARPLIVVGGNQRLQCDLETTIESMGLTHGVKVLGKINNSTLRWLYENCFGFCYPSFLEGFFFPVIEAMSLGAAIIVPDTPNFRELAGESAIYVNSGNPQSIADSLNRAHCDQTLRAELKKKSKKRANKYSWPEMVGQIHQIYLEAYRLPKRAEKPAQKKDPRIELIDPGNQAYSRHNGVAQTAFDSTVPVFIYRSEKRVKLVMRILSWFRRFFNKNMTVKNTLKQIGPINKFIKFTRSKLSKEFPNWV